MLRYKEYDIFKSPKIFQRNIDILKYPSKLGFQLSYQSVPSFSSQDPHVVTLRARVHLSRISFLFSSFFFSSVCTFFRVHVSSTWAQWGENRDISFLEFGPWEQVDLTMNIVTATGHYRSASLVNLFAHRSTWARVAVVQNECIPEFGSQHDRPEPKKSVPLPPMIIWVLVKLLPLWSLPGCHS